MMEYGGWRSIVGVQEAKHSCQGSKKKLLCLQIHMLRPTIKRHRPTVDSPALKINHHFNCKTKYAQSWIAIFFHFRLNILSFWIHFFVEIHA